MITFVTTLLVGLSVSVILDSLSEMTTQLALVHQGCLYVIAMY